MFSAQVAQHSSLYEDSSVRTERLQDVLTERVAGWMRLVLAAVAVLMAIGCVNVSSLLLTRSMQRRRDVSIRLSLGATHIQVMAAALVEGVLLAGCATLAGLVAASWLLAIVKAALPSGIVLASAVQVDGRVFLACAAAGGLTALVAGLVPGWRVTRAAPAQVLRNGSVRADFRRVSPGYFETAGASGSSKGVGSQTATGELLPALEAARVDPLVTLRSE